MARDECPNVNDEGSVNATSEGVCIQFSDNSKECYVMVLILNDDQTFTFSQITTTTNGGIIDSRNYSEAGTYTFSDNQIITVDVDGLTTTYSFDNSFNNLDWIAAKTDNGCDRIFRFSK